MSDGIETIRNAHAGDVAVRKTIETGDDDTATVTLEVTADHEEALVVRLTEPALADVPTDDVDFNGEYGAEHWRLDDGAVFEGRLDGGESCTVVYRVRNLDEERFRYIDADPEIEIETDVPGALDDVVDRESSEAVRRLIEGRADSLSTDEIVEAEAEAPTDGRPTEAGNRRPGDGPPPGEWGAGEVGDGTDRRGPSVDAPGGVQGASDSSEGTTGSGIAEGLLAELRAGEVDDEVTRELREELQVGKSHDVRIKHLQRQVGDLAAYVDVLESFIDEHGTFEEAFGDLQGDVAALEERLDEVESFADRLSGVFQDVDEDGDH